MPFLPGGHNKQLYNHLHEVQFQLALFFRSIFAMVHVYNLLPQYVVDARDVKDFQKHLTRIVRFHCSAGAYNWQNQFSRR